MAQIMRPISQVTATNGAPTSNVHLVLDGTAPDTGDYYAGNDNATGVCEVLLTSLASTPPDTGTCTVTIYHAQCDGNSAPSSGGANSTWDLEVYEGATQRASVTGVASNEGSFASYSSLTFSSSVITNWADVRVRFTSNGTGGSPSGRRGAAISYVEISTPDTSTDVSFTANAASKTLTTYPATVQQQPRVWLNSSQTKTGADEMTVTSWNTAGTSITFTDPSGGQTGSLFLGVERPIDGAIGWIAVTVSGGDVSFTANAKALTLSTHAPSISYDVDVTPGVASKTLTTYPASVALDVSFTANAAPLTLTTYPATIFADTGVTAGVVGLTRTTYPATVAYDVNVSAGVASKTVATYQATITHDRNVDVGVAAKTLATHQASISYDVEVSANAAALTLTTHAASVAVGTNVSANVAPLTLTTYPATILADTSVSAGVVGLTVATYQATISYDLDVSAGVASKTITTYPASIAYDVGVSANAKALTLAVYNPTVEITASDVSFVANAAALSIATHAASIAYDINVVAGVAGLTRAVYNPTVTVSTPGTYTEAVTRSRRGWL